jgi:hypothetical protein
VSGNGNTIFEGGVATHKHIYNSGARDLWPPEFQEVSPNSLGTIAAAQREFSRQARADTLLESFDAGTQDGKSARARLLSCTCRPASTCSLSPGPLSSRVGKSALASATALKPSRLSDVIRVMLEGEFGMAGDCQKVGERRRRRSN